MLMLKNNEDPRNIDRFIFTIVVIFSEDDLCIDDFDSHMDIIDKMNKSNNPIVKWVDNLLKKYDCGELVDEYILGDSAPVTKQQCEERLLKFFKALEKKTGYSPEQAIKDIRKLLN